jgi:hypothetical protein
MPKLIREKPRRRSSITSWRLRASGFTSIEASRSLSRSKWHSISSQSLRRSGIVR